MLLTLIVLVAMTLAAIALIRSVDTTNVVAGNLAFKQAATQVADEGTELAIQCLSGTQNTTCPNGPFAIDQDSDGYYHTVSENLDPTGGQNNPNLPLVDWGNNGCNGLSLVRCYKPSPTYSNNGYEISYIAFRLCVAIGGVESCLLPNTGSSDICRDDCGGVKQDTSTSPYYRIITRVQGPRNTVSFIETIVQF